MQSGFDLAVILQQQGRVQLADLARDEVNCDSLAFDIPYTALVAWDGYALVIAIVKDDGCMLLYLRNASGAN